jgi:p-hydroxybenzoate 3-monooxygenase
MRTQVGIVGAGPAGLTLAHLLHLEGIDSVILEDRSREYVEARVRAGVLEQGVTDLLIRAGVGERMQREGLVHHGIGLQFDGERHRIPLHELTGKAIVIYGQTEIVKDLIAARLETGRPLLFEVSDVALADLETERPRVTFRHDGARARVRPDRRLRRLSRRLSAEHPGRRADRVLPRVPVRLARDSRRSRALDGRGRLHDARARLRPAQPP